ncbi:MAG: type II toxin-antitoxin system prevent-host-death family antitoxin [Methylobacter sp.]|nr:MAG: type II toxin-antitoxin system prevent-host-death family antitoxin [Methylobacter sp.]
MKATAKDLRIHSKGLLDAESKGEMSSLVSGVNLVPYEKTDKSADVDSKNDLFGIWADRTDIESVEEYMQSLRKGSSLLGCSKITFI